MINLKEEWVNLCSKYSNNQNLINELFEEIKLKYTQKHRYYHNLNHISELLELLDKYGGKLQNPEIVKFAIWYHDIIYNPLSNKNELQSQQLAINRLQGLCVNSNVIENVSNFIHSTKLHERGLSTYDFNFFIDLDLSILGVERNSYREYIENIRKENKFIPNFIYKYFRGKFLKSFYNLKEFYYTEEIKINFESNVKPNLEFEMNLLGIKNIN